MTIYIPSFWLGVASVILIELITFVVIILRAAIKKGKNNG